MVKIIISENDGNQRLDRFLKKYLKNASLGFIYKIIRKDVKINGKRGKIDTTLNEGDEISLYLDEKTISELTEKKKKINVKKQFDIAYEDENILIVNKPSGLLTHGDRVEKKNTLTNQVNGYLYEKGEYDPIKEKTFTPASVNRLDRNTSGLVIFGKNHETIKELNRHIKEKNMIDKYYITIVYGVLAQTTELKDKAMKDKKKNKTVVLPVNTDDGQVIETIVYPIKSNNGYTLCEVKLITGRTHQIRAHLAKEKFPVIGDKKYGNKTVNKYIQKEFDLNSQFLHAYKIVFKKMTGALSYLQGKTVECKLPKKLEIIKSTLVDS